MRGHAAQAKHGTHSVVRGVAVVVDDANNNAGKAERQRLGIGLAVLSVYETRNRSNGFEAATKSKNNEQRVVC